MSDEGSGSRRFSILMVCVGNVCRSPAAALLLRSALGDEHGVTVTSAGTRALVGASVPAPMAALLRKARTRVDDHRGRQLEAGMVRDSDLVLTMTRELRAEMLALNPGGLRRTFTLREFHLLLENRTREDATIGSTIDRLSAAVPYAASRRGSVVDSRAADLDVPDPFRGSDAEYSRSFELIEDAVLSIARAVKR